jgi:ureidoglycolate dehydrogenase (NAD+)
MPQVRFDTEIVDPGALRTFCCRLLGAVGVRPGDAQLVADTLVEANLRGTDSHGVARLPHYLRRIGKGSINPAPDVAVQRLGHSCARVEGDNGLGQVVMQRATEEAIALAAEAGAGWVSVAGSSHCGALAYYGLQIADAGMIGLVFSHVDSMVLPFGARRPFCGTNPICIAAPRETSGAERLGSGALCLDMATSKVPWNTVTNAAIEDVPIENGWAVDADGKDTNDAKRVAALYPFGGYKGSGLGLLIDVLCAMLSGAPFGPDIPPMYGDLAEPRRLGGMVGAIDIRRFVPLPQFHQRVAELIERWTALPPCEPGGEVLFPGQPELLHRERRLREGIPLGRKVLRELAGLASEHGIRAVFEQLVPTPAQIPMPHILSKPVPTVLGRPSNANNVLIDESD